MSCRFSRQSGIFPDNRLLETSRITNLLLLHIDLGIDPFKRLCCRSIILVYSLNGRFIKDPISLLLERSKLAIMDIFRNHVGRGPYRLVLDNSRLTSFL
ncbi:hypothetical protein HanXRQr2_Chr08g0325911 [Helianthus annuus]|uniref:Uncharacterized protein n=1 Tax=Helianthus annuus TaxID=4232 RepID=A0A9K3NBD9_HELAN|nr:hypothetical protein HanXRQr2_Chr08g0325911 [Helianthus annuus]